MASREPYQVASLKSHIANAKQSGGGAKASKSITSRPSQRATPSSKKQTSQNPNSIFGNNDDSEDGDNDKDSSNSDSDSDAVQENFLNKITGSSAPSKAKGTSASRRRSRDEEIADSDAERNPAPKKSKKEAVNGGSVTKVKKEAQKEADSSDDSSGESGPESAQPEPKVTSKAKKLADTNGKTKKKIIKQEPESSSSEAESESDSDSDTSSSESEEGPVEKAAKNDKEDPQPVESDKDTSDDSSDEDSSESEAGSVSKAKPVAKKSAKDVSTTTTTSAASTTSSEDESDSEPEPEPEPQPKKQKKDKAKTQTAVKPPSKPAPKVNGAKSKEYVTSSSESGSGDEGEKAGVDDSMHMSDREDDSGKQIAVPKIIAPDFMLRRKEEGLNGKDVAEIWNKANLEGKQVFYFTVPSNVPVSVMQTTEFSMDPAQQNNPVFSHNGEDYGMSFDTMTPKSNIQILIPSASSSQYQASPRQVDQVFQIKRITQLGASSTNDTAGPAPQPPARPQPEGLKARFKPIGVYDSVPKLISAEDQDTEMTEAPAVAQKLSKKDKKKADKIDKTEKAEKVEKAEKPKEKEKKEKKEKKSKRRAEEEGEKPSSQQNASSSPLKRKHTPSEDEAALASSQLLEENQSAEATAKKRKTERKGSPDLGSERKETPVLPPTLPELSQPLSSAAAEVSTPAPKKSKASKKNKASETPGPISSMETEPPSTAKKNTPVPLPSFPGSSQLRSSPIPTKEKSDKPKKSKGEKSSKSKDKKSGGAARPSSQPADDEGSSYKGATVTPIPAPTFGRSSS